MRHRAPIALLLALLALASCRPSLPRIIAPEVVADASSAFVIIDSLSLYTLSGSALTYKEPVPLGEKLSLSGKTAIVTQAGRDRDFREVKRASGTIGWVRADQVVAHAMLSAVTATEAPLYVRPAEGAMSGAALQRASVLAIDIDTAGTPFLRITAYDTAAKMLLKGVYMRNEGVSSRVADVESAILLRLAAASPSLTQRNAFLSSGIKDYSDSAFVEDLRAARAVIDAPATPAPDTAAPATAP